MNHASGPDPRAWLGDELRFLPDSGVWAARGASDFAYPDPPGLADRIRTAINHTTDLSSASSELHERPLPWPLNYFLKPERANLLRPFPWDRSARVVEIGAGYGALTRFLGETFAEVVAIEGDPTRAALTRLRTQDLANVTVVNAPLHELRPAGQADLAIAVGVLEYAEMFVPSPRPDVAALRLMRELLTADGTLVLAIENKLGLKYFAGLSEDHWGAPFEGIEGYPRAGHGGPRTYGRRELLKLLQEAGYHAGELFLAFPDYKFTRCLVRAATAECESRPSLGDLVATASPLDQPWGRRAKFDLALAWREISANRLEADLANSFLAFASSSRAEASLNPPWDAVYLNTARRRPYWTTLEVYDLCKDPSIDRSRMLDDGGQNDSAYAVNAYSGPWISKPSLLAELIREARQPGITVESIGLLLEPWRVFVQAACGSRGTVSGDLLDARPANGYVEDGRFKLFDHDLVATESVSADFVFVRGLIYTIQELAARRKTLGRLRGLPGGVLLLRLARCLGQPLGPRALVRFAMAEADLQKAVLGRDRWTTIRSLGVTLVLPLAAPRPLRATPRARRVAARARSLVRGLRC